MGSLKHWDHVILGVFTPIMAIQWLIKFILHQNPALHWRQRLALTFLQTQRQCLPPRLLLSLVRRVPTGQAVSQYCIDNSISHQVVRLDADGGFPAPILHILTVPTGSETGPTLFYIHGGGYVYPLRGPAHMPFILRCATACRARQVVILEYALAPEHPYPCQLVNAVTALSHLLQPTAPGLNLKPEDIVLAGDSAGGQLVGAILAHIAYPSPYTAPLKLHGQFRAALLVSPFVRLAPPGMSSYESNHGRDYLTKPQIDVFAAAWAAREDDIWANLCGVEEASKVWGQVFASGPTRLVRKVMVTVGTAEIFLECCRVFAREYVQAKTIAARKDMDFGVFEGMDAVLAECEGEVHVQPALDSVVGYDNGVMEQAIMSWLKGV